MTKETQRNYPPKTRSAIIIFLRLEAVVLLTLPAVHLFVKKSLFEQYDSFGMPFPVPTVFAHSPAGIGISMTLGVVLLLFVKYMSKTGKTTAAKTVSIFILIIILLQVTALYLPYWKLELSIGS